jgi:lipopolysaccharide/colanic/teichoic acid biosynthesis glycosyltransferase
MADPEANSLPRSPIRQSALRRVIDVAVAATGLALTWWIGVIAAVAVRLSSPGPVLYGATRAARGHGTFTLYKFRSMVVDADRVGPAVTIGADPRVTRVGAILRATKLDEWPQLWNVLVGDMSLVGPRPEDPRYVEQYSADQRPIMEARPGITSPASVRYRHESAELRRLVDGGLDLEEAYATILDEKLRMDLDYLRRRSVCSDLSVIGATLAAVARRD